VRSDKLGRLVDENVEVQQLGTGFTFTEGPIWNPEGQFLLFSDMPADTRRRWDEANGIEEILSPSNKGNGMTLDAEGRLIVCEHSTSSLVRMDPDGKNTNREVLASHYEGQELNSPNDVCVKSDGSIWFSDPWYGRMFFEAIGSGVIEEGIPDGMKCDEEGNVWVTGPGGVWVISPEGEHLGVLKIPENTGNLAWGGPDWHTLFIPSSTSLYAVKTKVGPRREPYMS